VTPAERAVSRAAAERIAAEAPRLTNDRRDRLRLLLAPVRRSQPPGRAA
jgi:hypothetical protein